MEKSIMKLVGITVFVAIVLVVMVVAANAQNTCVLHSAGDMVPCTHLIWTPYGYRLAHPYDVVPCTHFVPCFGEQSRR